MDIDIQTIEAVFDELSPHVQIQIILGEHNRMDDDNRMSSERNMHRDLFNCAIDSLIKSDNICTCIELILDETNK